MPADRVVGLFAGIGGIELGFHLSGYRTELLCEIDPLAQAVLKSRFPGIPLEPDVRRIKALPRAEVVAAGFPCQDLSQAGNTAGIRGKNSSLVTSVFKILRRRESTPRWLLLENVPFMLQLHAGKAMSFLVDELEDLGFMWAYRVVDARAFGLPQRRQRVLLLASRTEDPREVLFQGEEQEPEAPDHEKVACGFYWTEGIRGLGWAVDAVPTLKGGSTVGIPSPPAIRLPFDRTIVTPDIRDAERLQGFPHDWTLPAVDEQHEYGRKGWRWRLVGNAVSVPVARWLGMCLQAPEKRCAHGEKPLKRGESWPKAAWGRKGESYRVDRSPWPVREPYQHLVDFLSFPSAPLSERATAGFLERTKISSLHFPSGFLRDVRTHAARMRRQLTLA
jgi:DNA (cytosine-5)-methyltransferase 1